MLRPFAPIALAAALAAAGNAYGQPPVASIAAAPAPALVPQPRELQPRPDIRLPRGLTLMPAANADDRFALRELAAALEERHVRVGPGGVPVALHRVGSAAARAVLRRSGVDFEPGMREEGYVLLAANGRVDIVGASAAGVFYGVQTLKQLVEGTGQRARLRGATIRDWPAMRWRGLHDDLSRGPMPTLDFQKKQIRTLAAYKVNLFSPYFEHTLEYPDNPLPAPPGGSMTPADVAELVAYAKRYHIEVVPEQEAFGHLHHLLKWEAFSSLGETPHGHVLAPGDPGSLPLIRQMFTELDSLFPGRFLHIGADETFELGRGRSREAVEREGIGTVYLDFLKRIEEALRPLGRRLLFWGDIAMREPELVRTLPHDMIAVAWTYGPRESFDRYIVPFRDAGMETWVAPGVNNWSRPYPNYANALVNIRNFVRDGQRLGATGVLNTSWDDDGEALFNQVWYGALFGAAVGWQSGESSIDAFQDAFGRVFHGDSTGRIDEVQRKLIAAHTLLKSAGLGDASDWLFWVDPWSEEGQLAGQRMRPVAGQLRLLAEGALRLLLEARRDSLRESDALDALELGARRIDFIGMKFQLADEIVQAYGRAYAAASDTAADTNPNRDLSDLVSINGRFQDLRDGYSLLRDLYEAAWLRENRPYWLRNVLARYDAATQLWLERLDRVYDARRRLSRDQRLPPPGEVGVPASLPGL